MAPPTRFVVRVRRWRHAFIAGIAVGLAGLYVFFLLNPEGPARPDPSSMAGLAPLALVGACSLWNLAHPPPALVIDARGIFVGCSMGVGSACVPVGWIAWSEIAGAEVYTHMGCTVLGILLRDREVVLGRLPTWKRLLLRANIGLGFEAISIPRLVLALPAEEVAAVIRDSLPTRRDPVLEQPPRPGV